MVCRSIALAGLQGISVCTRASFCSMVRVGCQDTSTECLSLRTTLNIIGFKKRVPTIAHQSDGRAGYSRRRIRKGSRPRGVKGQSPWHYRGCPLGRGGRKRKQPALGAERGPSMSRILFYWGGERAPVEEKNARSGRARKKDHPGRVAFICVSAVGLLLEDSLSEIVEVLTPSVP